MWNLLLFGPAFFGAGVGDYSSSEGRVRGREEASPEFAATDKIAVQLVKLEGAALRAVLFEGAGNFVWIMAHLLLSIILSS